jgi:hypothetical protein
MTRRTQFFLYSAFGGPRLASSTGHVAASVSKRTHDVSTAKPNGKNPTVRRPLDRYPGTAVAVGIPTVGTGFV